MAKPAPTSVRLPGPTASILPKVPERPAEVHAALHALGIVPSKKWGQSFLTDPFVADAEAALVEHTPGQRVVEIGGGLGMLTSALLRHGVQPLTVVERDPRLAAYLRSIFRGQIHVVQGDALEIPLPPGDCFVGNLPYSVATPILSRLFSARVPRVVFLVQREVAERLAAGPGSKAYGRLSIVAQCYGSIELFRTVNPEAFSPQPSVESRLGVYVARKGLLPVGSIETLERVLSALFSSRRKQLGNLLPRLVPSSSAADQLARDAGWPLEWRRSRPEDLPPEAFFAVSRCLEAPA